jgi:hypothetical protein
MDRSYNKISLTSPLLAYIITFIYLISAYVCGEKSGLILESPYHFGDSLNGVAEIDINVEKNLVMEKLGELREKGATEQEIKVAMKDLGITRFVKIIYFKFFFF